MILYASCVCRCPQRSKGIGFFGTGVTGGYEPPAVASENKKKKKELYLNMGK